MTMSSEEAREIIRLLKPVSRYCELKLQLDDMENEVQDQKEELEEVRAEETRFNALPPEQRVELFDGVMRTLLSALSNYESLGVDGVVDGECDEVQEFLESRGLGSLFSFESSDVRQLVDKIDESLSGSGE